MSKLIKTAKGRILLESVPSEANYLRLRSTMFGGQYLYSEMAVGLPEFSKELSPGEWELIGTLDTILENQAVRIVDKLDSGKFMNYHKTSQLANDFQTALYSLASLLYFAGLSPEQSVAILFDQKSANEL